jgi:hypothetical protein
MKRLLIGAAFALAFAGQAFAQSTPLPTVPTVTPTSDVLQIIPRGAPSAQNLYVPLSGVQSSEQYAKVAITTASNYSTSPGYSNTFQNFQSDILVTAPGTLSYLYFTFAPNPSDGARECFYANQTVTTAYPTANTTLNAQVVNASNTITSMTASTRYCFLYSVSNLQWDRD